MSSVISEVSAPVAYLYALRARRSAHAVLEGLSTAPFASQCHSFPLLCEFSLPLRTLEGPQIKRRRKKTPWSMYTSYLCRCCLRRTWTVLPAENSTSFSPVKPSVRPHHGEQALRIRDIISLSGKVVLSIFPTTLPRVEVLQREEKKKETVRKRS